MAGEKEDAEKTAAIESAFNSVRPFKKDAYGEAALKPIAKDGDEWGRMHKTEIESKNSRYVTLAGITILILVTIFACFSLVGLTNYNPDKSHEDAVRIILLIVGGVIGALYGVSASKSK